MSLKSPVTFGPYQSVRLAQLSGYTELALLLDERCNLGGQGSGGLRYEMHFHCILWPLHSGVRCHHSPDEVDLLPDYAVSVIFADIPVNIKWHNIAHRTPSFDFYSSNKLIDARAESAINSYPSSYYDEIRLRDLIALN